MKQLLIILIVVFLLPLTSLAAKQSITRAEAFDILWEPLNRPAKETNEIPFSDVFDTHTSFLILTYGKSRGILDDEVLFRPNDPLHLNDALVWLLRSRNTDAPSFITQETINSYTNRYDLLEDPQDTVRNAELSREEFLSLMNKLDTTLRNESHIVSYYAEDFAGRNTAFGEIFDPNALTAAHRTFPHNTLLRVRNPENGKSVVVRVNDRGPYAPGRDLDLSRAAFGRLASYSNGLIRSATFERLGSSEVVTECPAVRYQRRLGRALLFPGIPRIISKGTVISLTSNRSFRLIQMRAPGMRPVRSAKWTGRGEELTLNFESEGIYTFVLHEDSGRRRRFRTRVVEECM